MKTKPQKQTKRGTPTAKPLRAARGSAHLAKTFLEHAARETTWMKVHATNCDYKDAHDAGVRRGVWLTAALIVQELSAPNNVLGDDSAKHKP